MLAAKISRKELMKSVFLYAIINCVIFIVTVMAFKYLNLLHVWGLRITHYVIVIFVCLYQARRIIRKHGAYLPFLRAFSLSLFTGILAFALYGLFILLYSLFDPYLAKIFITDSQDDNILIPALIVFFEGSGASIIVALIVMIFAARFEDGELS